MEYSEFNGDWTVENPNEPNPLKRTFKLNDRYLYHFPDPDNNWGGDAWCINSDKQNGGYNAELYYNSTSELTNGTINWSSMMGSATTQCTVTKTNYPEVQLVLKGQKVMSYDEITDEWQFASGSTSFDSCEKEPRLSCLYNASGKRIIGNAVRGVGSIPTSGLDFYWKGTQKASETGQSMHTHNDPTYTTLLGIPCAYFYGDSSIETDGLHPFTTGARTFSVWVWALEYSGQYHPVFSIGSFNKDQAFNIEVPANTSIRFSAWDDYIGASAKYTFPGWHHVAVSYDGTTVRLYVDGVLNGERAMSLNTTPSSYGIGGGVNGDLHKQHNFKGYVAGARAYTRALTAVEIVALAAEYI
jgi:hypothetical protein